MQNSEEPGAGTASPKPSDSTNRSPIQHLSAFYPRTATEANTRKYPAANSPTPSKDDDATKEEVTNRGTEIPQATDTSTTVKTAEEESILHLLEIAKASGFAPVAVPGNLLAKVLTSMSNLQAQVSALKSDVLQLGAETSASRTILAHTKMELMAAKDKSGITSLLTFPLFPKLPVEVRLLIWKCVLYTPRIMKATKERPAEIDNTKQIWVRGVCKEARAEAQKCQKTLLDVQDTLYFESPCIFTNVEVDTIWLCGRDIEEDLSSPWLMRDFYSFLSDMPYSMSHHQLPDLSNVVVTLKDWEAFVDEANFSGSDDFNMYFGIRMSEIGLQNIKIVVGDTTALSCSDIVHYIAPRKSPAKLLPSPSHTHISSSIALTNVPELAELSWEGMASRYLENLAEFQKQRTTFRDQLIKDGIDPDNEDSCPYDFEAVRDCTWSVKSIRFVEAVTGAGYEGV